MLAAVDCVHAGTLIDQGSLVRFVSSYYIRLGSEGIAYLVRRSAVRPCNIRNIMEFASHLGRSRPALARYSIVSDRLAAILAWYNPVV
jgi:hypothetical protein